MRAPGRPARLLIPALLLPLALAACGGSDSDGGGTTSGSSASGSSSSDVTARLEASSKALAAVKSYHLVASQTDPDGYTTITGDITAEGRASVLVRLGPTALRLKVLPGAAYARGNAEYWTANLGKDGKAVADRIADTWVKLPASSADVTDLLDGFAPKTLAACLLVGNGTLKAGPQESIDGTPADVLIDAGDQPGTSPSRLLTATSGPPLPLRVVQTGPRRPGGTPDKRCDDPDDRSTASEATLSAFDRPVTVEAPDGAIELPGGDAGSGASS
ncbi:hypothetical protein AB0L40_16000 [Patulibacter sp. NPDC049589]|uniref:hypothetical protein n=1 Tax=Patulibacter sp. NPDC049589 TaxID=3154731 RepID=UPI00341FCFF3